MRKRKREKETQKEMEKELILIFTGSDCISPGLTNSTGKETAGNRQ